MGAHTSKTNKEFNKVMKSIPRTLTSHLSQSKTEVIATATTLSIFFAIVLGVSIYIANNKDAYPEGYNFVDNVVCFFKIISFVIYFLILLPYHIWRLIYERYKEPPSNRPEWRESFQNIFVDKSWENPVWKFFRFELIIKALLGDADMFHQVKEDIKRVLAIINKFFNMVATKSVDAVFDTRILEEEFTSNEEYVNEMFRYIYFAAMYIFSMIVLNHRHTDIIGFGFVSILNIISLFLFSNDLGKYMGPVFFAPFIFVYFPWLVLAAASGLILYMVFRLKWAYGKRDTPVKFLKHEAETYKRMKHIFTATTVIMFCLSALFVFARSSALVRLIMVLLLAATLSLDIVLLTEAVKIYKKDVRHIHVGSDQEIEQPDFLDQVYNVFQNINMNYMLHHDTDLGL
jgi:hypothetical protein